MLQFMQPAVASRDAIGKDRLARRDEARRHAAAPSRDRGTHQHGSPNLCSLRRFGSPCDNRDDPCFRPVGSGASARDRAAAARLTLPAPMFSLRSMAVETLGEAWRLGWKLTARCAFGNRDGMKSIRECIYRAPLDMQTLVWTRGPNFPLSRLESRLMCPECGLVRGRFSCGRHATSH
jgi:hypothetical protein